MEFIEWAFFNQQNLLSSIVGWATGDGVATDHTPRSGRPLLKFIDFGEECGKTKKSYQVNGFLPPSVNLR